MWLKVLEQSHKGKIDVIYIDPPYNTLNRDFAYNDRYIDAGDSFKHSKWLEFMFCRLVMARRLLTDDGVILISTDDNEYARLKLLMDEIFGEDCCLGTMIQLKGNTQNDSKRLQRNHEYVMCYCKSYHDLLMTYTNEVMKPVYEDCYILGRDTGASSGHDKLIERANLGYTIYYIEHTANGATGNHNKLIERANQFNARYGLFEYYISNDGSKFIHAIAVKDYDETKVTESATTDEVYTDCQDLIDAGYVPIRPPVRKGGKLGRWTWGLTTFQGYWNNNEVIIKNNRNIIRKHFIDADDIREVNGRKMFVKQNRLPLQSIIDITNSRGTVTLKGNDGVLPGSTFNNPKSVELLKYLITAYHRQDNLTILDFFAGSGTTAQAVAELNAEDGGNRRWILVTNNEGETDDDPSTGIMRSVTKPRIDAVLTGLRPDGTRYSNGTGDGYSFLTYDIDSIPRSESPNKNRRMLTIPQCLDGFIRIRWGVTRSDIRSSGSCFPVDYLSKTTHVVALLTEGNGKVELDDIRSEAQALVNEEDRQRVIVAPAAAVLVARPIWDTIVGDADIELLSYDDLFDNDFLS